MSLGDSTSSVDGGDASVPTSFSVYAVAEQGKLSLMTSYLAGGGNVNKRSKEGYSILHLAAMRDQEAMVKLLLRKGADPDVHDNGEGLTPLMWAAQLGYAGVVTALLEEGADMEEEDREDLTALHWAARLGQERVVLVLLEHGADVEAIDYDGNTPLIWATRGGHRACVGYLLDNGASTKTPDENGNTPLHFSCQMGNAGITSDLLDWGALATAQDYWEFTPFHRACSQGHGDVLVELLKAREPGIKGGKSEGGRVGSGRLARAWGGGGGGGGSSGNLAPTHGLRSEVVDIRNHFQATPLHRAAAKGHAEVVTMLVQNGADIDSRDGFYYTPLHLACVNGAAACVEVLLLAGADPGIRAQGGVTPLIAARKPEVRELVKEALASRKGSLWEVDTSGQSAIGGGSRQGGGEGQGQAGVRTDEGENTARVVSASASTTAGLAPARSAVLATTGGTTARGMDVDEQPPGNHARRDSETSASCRSDWDAEMRPALGAGADAAAPPADAGEAATTPRGRPMSRLPREREGRRAGTSGRPRRSSTGSVLEKLFNSSSGPYQPQKIKDEEEGEVGAVTTAAAAAQMVSVSLASSMDTSTEASTESSADGRDSHSCGAMSAALAEGGDENPDAFEAAEATEVPVLQPGQMIPETPLHLAPRRPPSPRRSSHTVAPAAPAAVVAGNAMETVALELPRFVGSPLDAATVPTLPRVVSAEDGDVRGTTDPVAAPAESLPASGVAPPPPLGSSDGPAPASAPATDGGAVGDRPGVGGGGNTVGKAGMATPTAVATTTTPTVPASRRASHRGVSEREQAPVPAPARVRAKKRRAKSLPPSTRRDRRPRGPRPCLQGPGAVIKTLTLEDGDEDGDDGEAWALSQWLHGATGSVAAAVGSGGGGAEDSPPPSPGMIPLRRATTLVGKPRTMAPMKRLAQLALLAAIATDTAAAGQRTALRKLQDTTCDGGIPGVQKGDVCCVASCGECRGAGCADRDGGPDYTGEEACCNAGVNSLGRICSAEVGAPCVFVDGPTCDGGIPGVQKGDVCCVASCGECRGAGCADRDGGPDYTGEEACCNAGVNSLGRICSAEVGAPCIFDEDATPSPTTPAPATPAPATSAPATPAPATPAPATPAPATPAPATPAPATPAPATPAPATPGPITPAPSMPGDPTCSNGVPGYEASGVCCPLSCGECGGVGCSSRGEGCCTSGVKESGDLCSVTMAAPCNIDGDVDDSTCSNGLPGYEKNDVCCPLSCGECGGSGCSSRGEGCCTSDVKESGDLCSVTMAAPCNIDGDVDDSTCSNGLPGYEASGVCCPLSCGECGGVGCSSRGEGCCTSGVKESGDLCSVTMAAPCNIDGDIDDSTCSNGLPGYETNDVCCPLSCGECGGSGCSSRGEGCCTSDVKESGDLCSVTMAAPCNIDGDVDDSTCSNGLPGYETNDVCCPLSCGECGGSGCSSRGEGCCTSDVKESGDLCSVTMAAPCNIDGDVDGEGCSGRDGGDSFSGGEACCLSGVQSLGRTCSADVAAPCVVA
eukprot:g6876.t1